MANKLDNLKKGKKFTKGDPRINKNGRPKKLPELDALLEEILGDDKGGITAAKIMLNSLFRKACNGDVKAAELLLDRAYGKSKQQIDLGGSFQINTPAHEWAKPTNGNSK